MAHSVNDFDFTSLSPVERLQLAQALLESVLETDAEPFTGEQMAELQRRLDDIDAGRGSFEPWETVRERLLSRR
jgi:putative addiction module component (TIGR02574 family)